MTRLPSVILPTKTPCCARPVRFRALVGVPREVYVRKCAVCGKRWSIDRRCAAERPGRRIDILEWTREPHFGVLITGDAPVVEAERAAIAKAEGSR